MTDRDWESSILPPHIIQAIKDSAADAGLVRPADLLMDMVYERIGDEFFKYEQQIADLVQEVAR